jgi:ubiquinone/menaquinone biosynthesis C-methylase UbiE
MNCDHLASFYRWLEYLRYGKALERCRATMLPWIGHARKALIIGDGDGRFTDTLLRHNETVAVDSIELSRKMIELARRRITTGGQPHTGRVTFEHGDIRIAAPSDAGYDLVATHFFFDVFPTAELKCIIGRVTRWTAPDALWVVSEFNLPASGWQRAKARFWLRTMYTFFRVTTDLRNQNLPSWRPLLREAGFVPRRQVRYKNGFIVSELWQRTPLPPIHESCEMPPGKVSRS